MGKYYQKKTTGHCFMCGAEVTGTKKYCEECAKQRHRDQNLSYYHRMVSLHRCVFCGKPTNYTVACSECTKKIIGRRRKETGESNGRQADRTDARTVRGETE